MKVFVVYWHPEPQSFNAAMFQTACGTFAAAGHEVRTSDLHEMHFDPVSSRKNFTTVKEPNYLTLQVEEKCATELQLAALAHGAFQRADAIVRYYVGHCPCRSP